MNKTTSEIFEDPVGYLATFGIEAELVTSEREPLQLAA